MTTLDLAKSATHLIKIYPSQKIYGGNERFEYWLEKVLRDSSIGIDYRLTIPMNICSNRSELLEIINRNRGDNGDPVLTNGSKWPYYIDLFINKLKVGDRVLLVGKPDIVFYTAIIDSDCYFTNEDKWTNRGYSPGGFFHRRRLKNIEPLPKNTRIKNCSMANISIRGDNGWIFE